MNLCELVLASVRFRLFKAAPLHLRPQLPRSLQKQMIVVAHEAKGMNLPLGLLARLGQGFPSNPNELLPLSRTKNWGGFASGCLG